MIVAWLLFPIVVLVACLGAGLAVEWAAGFELPGTILPAVGLMAIIVVTSLAAGHAATAPLARPAVLVLVVVGVVLGRRRLRALRPRRWPFAAGLGVYAVCAAPQVLSGNATFLGYFVLNDGVFHFSLIHQLLSHGHDLGRVPPSSYQQLLSSYLSTSYPTGADLPIGVFAPVVGQDVAWLFQPFVAVFMSLGALAVYELMDGVIESRPLRTLSAFVAAQAALLYAYYLEGSIKEVGATALITTTVVLVLIVVRRPLHWRALIPPAVAAIAGLDVLGAAIAPWIALPLAVLVVALAWRLRAGVRRVTPRRRAIGGGLAVVVLGGGGALIVRNAAHFASVAQGVLTQSGMLGNLFRPLPHWEALGIWPADDFRNPVDHYQLAYALLGVAIASAVGGSLWAVRGRRWPPLLLLTGNGIAAVYLLTRANPYASGKVMMIFSLTVVLVAMLGPAALHDVGRRIEAWLLALALSGGVLWSNALAYHGASVAPRARLQALSAIDRRFAGQGPAFYNLADEYAAYFLRDLAPTDPSLGAPAARVGMTAPVGRQPWDLDELSLGGVERFRLLVIGNAALTSRPPSNFRLVDAGRFYDVWKRTPRPRVLEHIPLGGSLFPSSVPSCRLVRALAAQAHAERARLVYDVRAHPSLLAPALASHPPDWGAVSGDPYSLIPRSEPGAVVGEIRVATTGRYQVEVAGSISQKLYFDVDGRRIGAVSYELGPPGQLIPVASVALAAGRHQVSIIRPDDDLTPGDGGTGRLLGPVLFIRGSALGQVAEIAPARAGELCGRPLDWLEIVR